MSDKNHKSEVFIRSDGWVFSEDGMKRLKEGGHKGFARFKESVESKLGKWHRVCKPLDHDAANIIKTVKGLVERGVFISSAIMKEAERRSHGGECVTTRSFEGEHSPAEFMRLTLTDDAFAVVRKMSNPEFREFVSNAVFRQMKTWHGRGSHPQ